MLFCDIIFATLVYAHSVGEELSDNLLRLHVVANSNLQQDIETKYDVRDKINEFINNENFSDKEQVINKLYLIEEDVNKYLKENGQEYSCRIIHTISDFPKKQYNNILMPAGRYECIKAVLGKGEGENWWCVAYPPLCFTESVMGDISAEGESKLKNELSDDAYKLIHSENTEYKIRFFAVDLLNKILK